VTIGFPVLRLVTNEMDWSCRRRIWSREAEGYRRT
jgi:hypothetical protein